MVKIFFRFSSFSSVVIPSNRKFFCFIRMFLMKMQFVASLQSSEISTVVSNGAYILRPGVAKQLVLSSPLKAIRPTIVNHSEINHLLWIHRAYYDLRPSSFGTQTRVIARSWKMCSRPPPGGLWVQSSTKKNAF